MAALTKISLTALQRINMRQVIRSQQPPTFDELDTLSDIVGKIDFADGVLESLMRDMGNGNALVDVEALKAIEDLEVEFEKAEVRLLAKIFEPGERFRPMVTDLVWYKPLRESIRRV